MLDIILDTNVIIYYSHGFPNGEKLLMSLDNPRLRVGISVITEAELLAKHDLSEMEHIILEDITSLFKKIDVNSSIARTAAMYRKNYRMKLADACIAATAKYFDIPLWTYNIKDFAQLTNVHVIQPPAHP